MAQANASAGVMISVGKELIHQGCQEFLLIMQKVQAELPQALNRVQFSYALLIFATLKVRIVKKV